MREKKNPMKSALVQTIPIRIRLLGNRKEKDSSEFLCGADRRKNAKLSPLMSNGNLGDKYIPTQQL